MSAPAAPGAWDTSGKTLPLPEKLAPVRSSGWACRRDATFHGAVVEVPAQSCVIRLYGLRLARNHPSRGGILRRYEKRSSIAGVFPLRIARLGTESPGDRRRVRSS